MENNKVSQLAKVVEKIDAFKTVSILRNLIKIPSFTGEEQKIGSYIASEMTKMGLEVIETYIDVENQRRNVLGVLRGNGGGRSLMICAHQDTRFPSEGEIGGNEARMIENRIYGIGAEDSMSPMAAMFAAVDAVKRSGVALKGDVIFLTTADEMGFKQGASLLEENGIRAHFCIMGEPTEFEIGILHTGKAEVEIRTSGKAAFEIAAYAERMGHRTINAILSMNTIINYLRRMEKEDPYFQATHPLLPGKGASMNIGAIIGGTIGDGDPTRRPGSKPGQFGLAKRTPHYCYLRVGTRYWPGQTADQFHETVEKWVEKAKEEDPGIDAEIDLYMSHGNDPFEISKDAELVQILKSSIKQILGREPKLIGNVYSSEGPFYKRAGMEFVWCSPGSVRSGVDESISIEDLIKAAKIYAAAIINICG